MYSILSEQLTVRLITVITMTNNSNANEDSQPSACNSASSGDDWQAFIADHAQELHDVERSHTARKFDKHARKQEKKALISIENLDDSAFIDGGRTRGPRDFSGSSWLDTDDVMDRYGDDFIEPNPSLGNPSATNVVLWILLIVGMAGIIIAVFVPHLASTLGVIFGVCILIGAAGLIMRHRGHDETKSDPFDDGARV